MNSLQKKELLQAYHKQKQAIKQRLQDFKNLPQAKRKHELCFCLLTPQSNAKKCWNAVLQLEKTGFDTCKIQGILKGNTRFHHNKAAYIKEMLPNWNNINKKIQSSSSPNELREYLVKNIKGLGMKEAGHFIRNIGKSQNQLAILDRHILKNLKELEIISNIPLLNRRRYLEIEQKLLEFSKNIQIPADELDLLFWSRETGEIFK